MHRRPPIASQGGSCLDRRKGGGFHSLPLTASSWAQVLFLFDPKLLFQFDQRRDSSPHQGRADWVSSTNPLIGEPSDQDGGCRAGPPNSIPSTGPWCPQQVTTRPLQTRQCEARTQAVPGLPCKPDQVLNMVLASIMHSNISIPVPCTSKPLRHRSTSSTVQHPAQQ